jgi:hypothetical protein
VPMKAIIWRKNYFKITWKHVGLQTRKFTLLNTLPGYLGILRNI